MPEIVHDTGADRLVVEDDGAVILAKRPRGRLFAADFVEHF